MQISFATPPRTAMEVFRMLPEGTLAEVIQNQLFMAPSPTPYHQEISGNLFTDINYFIRKQRLGIAYCAPVDLYLDESNDVVQPDILFFSKTNRVIIDKTGLHGVPDFIIEVLSPGKRKYDLVKKKKLYEKSGVKEYWVVDPETKIATGFLLKNKLYGESGERKGRVEMSIFKKSFSF